MFQRVQLVLLVDVIYRPAMKPFGFGSELIVLIFEDFIQRLIVLRRWWNIVLINHPIVLLSGELVRVLVTQFRRPQRSPLDRVLLLNSGASFFLPAEDPLTWRAESFGQW